MPINIYDEHCIKLEAVDYVGPLQKAFSRASSTKERQDWYEFEVIINGCSKMLEHTDEKILAKARSQLFNDLSRMHNNNRNQYY